MRYSFIVPAYNIQQYIGECLTSILSIDYDDFEVVVINDGSSDNTLFEIQRFNDKRVKIIDKNNGGLSEARNDGIRNANGKYLVFVDGDDFIYDKEFLNKVDKYDDSDVICYKYLEFDGNEFSKIKRNRVKKSQDDSISILELVKTNNYFSSAWSKVVKRQYILNNDLFFNSGLSEDIDWSYRILLYTNSIRFIDYAPYAYRINRQGSITNKVKTNFISGWCEIIDRCENYRTVFETKQRITSIKVETLNSFLANIAYIVYISSLKEDNSISYLTYYKYLKYGQGSRIKLIRIINFIFGKRFGFKIMKRLVG